MLKKLQYEFFTTKNIKPKGWLKEQLKVQAAGLNGNLDKVWPDVRDSAWIGGNRDSWERVPYWLDGFIPLAYLLEDEDMIARVKKYIDAIIGFQKEDGWICPCADNERGNYDLWAVSLILKVLTVYADCSGDERIPEVLEKCLKQFDTFLNSNTLKNWGAARWFECLIPIFWLYSRTHEEWLIMLAKKMQMIGFDWTKILGFIDSCTDKWGFQYGWNQYSHVVNVAMMLKSEALVSLMSDGNPTEFTEKMLDYLEKNHGNAVGYFNGDETLSGRLPINGTELCGVVEAMYSYEWLFAVTGDKKWLDKLEKLAYNSLPAAISPDMWSHQYDQMANQVAAFPMSKQPFRTNLYLAHTFGLEPEFGCCTANFGQGWPKFALSIFMKSSDGIVSCSLAPSEVKTEIDGIGVRCELDTQYPFRNTLTYRITAERPVEFTLSVRVPSSASGIEVDGKKTECKEFLTFRRVWNETEEIKIKLDFETNIVKRPNDMVCVWRGPLLYSIAIKEKWEIVEDRVEFVHDTPHIYPYCDYYLYPMSKWNYALADDTFSVKENDFVTGYADELPPVEMTAKMVEIPWGFNHGHCDAVPESREPISDVTDVRLVPYGFANLRMTEVPFIKK